MARLAITYFYHLVTIVPKTYFPPIVAIGLLVAMTNAASVQEPVSTWRISHEIDGYSTSEYSLCLVNKARTGGPEWAAMSKEEAGPDCDEEVVFDPPSKKIFLVFPGALSSPEYVCGSRSRISGRHPCNSVFFTSGNRPPDRRRLDRDMLKLALVESGAFVQMDRQMAASIEARHNECNRQLLAAAAVETLDSVLASCDGFIDADARLRASNLRVRLESEQRALAIRIESERKALALKSYRQDFSALTASSSTEQLVKFIDTYSRQDDPDRLVPKVRAMLDERRRQADLELAQQKQQQTLRDLEARIAQCKRMIAQARTSKEREQTMAAASGYVKPEVLRQAAAVEFDCTPVINDSYRRYRSLGGTRSQEEIQ